MRHLSRVKLGSVFASLVLALTAGISGHAPAVEAATPASAPWTGDGSVSGFATTLARSNSDFTNQPVGQEYGVDLGLNVNQTIYSPENGTATWYATPAGSCAWYPGRMVVVLSRTNANGTHPVVAFGHVRSSIGNGPVGVTEGQSIAYVAADNSCFAHHVEFMYDSTGGNIQAWQSFLPPSPLYRASSSTNQPANQTCPVALTKWTATGGQSLDPCYVLYSYMHGQIPYGPARGISLIYSTTGYVTTGRGNVEPFGGATVSNGNALWNVDYGRGVATCPGVDNYGYELDLYGGIHPLGTALPTLPAGNLWTHDYARGIVLRPDCHTGFILDLYGGIHSFASQGWAVPPTPTNFTYWSGWDIARGITYVGQINGVDSGYVLDGYGGVHPWGNAPATSGFTYWNGWDIARAIVSYGGTGAGYVLDGYGGVHPFGGAPAVVAHGTYWGIDVARALAIAPGAAGGYYVDTSGSVQTFTISQPCC
ncbi:MAG TPA: hypothetical protein VFB69_07550 [Candidatus Dormibacteraeota bacterium]|nr:hypothetical protein [Candidatus Dormibacteraeota bacterium]